MPGPEAAKRRAQLPLDALVCLRASDPSAARRWLEDYAEDLDGELMLFTQADLGSALSRMAQRIIGAQRDAAAEIGPSLTKAVVLRLIGEVMRDAGCAVELPDPATLAGRELEAAAESYGVVRRRNETDEELRERVAEAGR